MHPTTLPFNTLDHLATAIIVFDGACRIQYLNQVAEALLAVSARHVLQHCLDNHIGCDGESFTQLITQAQQAQAISKRRATLVTNDRTQITVDCLLNPVFDEHERIAAHAIH